MMQPGKPTKRSNKARKNKRIHSNYCWILIIVGVEYFGVNSGRPGCCEFPVSYRISSLSEVQIPSYDFDLGGYRA